MLASDQAEIGGWMAQHIRVAQAGRDVLGLPGARACGCGSVAHGEVALVCTCVVCRGLEPMGRARRALTVAGRVQGAQETAEAAGGGGCAGGARGAQEPSAARRAHLVLRGEPGWVCMGLANEIDSVWWRSEGSHALTVESRTGMVAKLLEAHIRRPNDRCSFVCPPLVLSVYIHGPQAPTPRGTGFGWAERWDLIDTLPDELGEPNRVSDLIEAIDPFFCPTLVGQAAWPRGLEVSTTRRTLADVESINRTTADQ